MLELAPQLQLTEEQIKVTRDIHARMEEQAKRLGAHLVEAEIALERLFQAETANEMSVRPALELIGQLQAELRGVHLLAHIQQKRVLSQEQTARYVRLRVSRWPSWRFWAHPLMSNKSFKLTPLRSAA